MRCSDCRPRRGCGGGCGDFSSRAARRPNLLEIEVVTQIFHAAMRNLVARDVDCARGLLSAEDIDAADDKLVHWVAQTFGGRNKHFEASDEWHPEGLARHILHVLASPMSGSMPVDDEEVLERAARLFIRDVRAMAGRLAGSALADAGAVAESDPMAELAERWAHLFVGAPTGDHLG